MWLSKESFHDVVANTPLISIDLIVSNEQGDFLLGERKNRPAQDYWFVPGGRVRKNETLDNAFLRLTQQELGIVYARHQAEWLGVYQHFYTDSIFGESRDAPSTHYIVLAYQLKNIESVNILVNDQHTSFHWWKSTQLLSDPKVHQYTKDYFKTYIQE